MNPPKVCVIGAGVIGISTALRLLQEIPSAKVTVIAEKFTPDTTSNIAAGFWEPYQVGDTPPEKIKSWSRETFQHAVSLATSPIAGEIGTLFTSGYILLNDELDDENNTLDLSWTETVFGFRSMTEEELKIFPDYRTGFTYTTVVMECDRYIPYMMQRIREMGGHFIKKKIRHIGELAGQYDVVVNCTGMGAAELVNDDKMIPICGHVIRVEAPWIKHFALTLHDAYILVRSDCIFLGGTTKHGDANTQVDVNDTRNILEGCQKVYPSLKDAKIIRENVGLRPGRSEVRLEAEIMKHGLKEIKIVHNYGHGGAGITLHWGCAGNAVALVKRLLGETQISAKL